ncbi:MAG: nucleotide exchange factor GrpE [Roseburia sp.]|nr:nucleotide exchange factor GrpE [Roseburia sp.]
MSVEEKQLDEQSLDEQSLEAGAASEDTGTEEMGADAEAAEETAEPEAEAQETADEEEGGEPPRKKSFLGKEKKSNKLQEKIDELEDRVKRQMAEFDNFRKRTEKEKNAMFETGAKSVVEKILPVVDNFERGLAGLTEEELKQPFAEGMNMVYKQLITELEKLDVKPIEAVGCEFDPELHNAVMQVESEEYESGIVAQELQKGYTYRDSVVRHSMVAVVS